MGAPLHPQLLHHPLQIKASTQVCVMCVVIHHPPACRCFFLHRPRVQLATRIAQRIEEMLLSGLMDEAAALLTAGMAPGVNNATKAIGYRQAMLYLQV